MEIINMSEMIVYRKHIAETAKKALERDLIIHGYMIYHCKHCGHVYFMNLEKGLKDPTNDAITGKHKSVPHNIICIACGHNATHILNRVTVETYGKNYRSYQKMVNKPNKLIFRNFFWNNPKANCGIPIVFEPDFSSNWVPPKPIETGEVRHYFTVDEELAKYYFENGGSFDESPTKKSFRKERREVQNKNL